MFSNQIKKTVLNKESGQRVIQRDFITFTQPVEDIQGSIEDFFNEYERLFFDIETPLGCFRGRLTLDKWIHPLKPPFCTPLYKNYS